ncbi:MAG: DUF554 family protein [Lachnospiraceae bacterium]|nr:DUF554 family protein [Lachnospiraceae bacterium]
MIRIYDGFGCNIREDDREQQAALSMACGISVLFIAIAGAMQGMMAIDGSRLVSGRSMLVVLCLAVGTVIGELAGIEKAFEKFGEWLKQKSGISAMVILEIFTATEGSQRRSNNGKKV